VEGKTEVVPVHKPQILKTYRNKFPRIVISVLENLNSLSVPLSQGYETRLNISLNYNQQYGTFSRSVYFYKLLYMFQAVPPPIIRSTKLSIQRQVLSDQCCCLLLSAGSSIGLTIPDAVCTVLCS